MIINTDPQQVRNASGSLLCELFYSGNGWLVVIKKKDCITILTLFPDGTVNVENTICAPLAKEKIYSLVNPLSTN